MSFDAFGLKPELLKAIKILGFEQPTPIQREAIPSIIDGCRDFVGLAQTGTGKTAAFGLPLLQLIDAKQSRPQGLIICPTRELCLQITGDLIQYARYLKSTRIISVYGGASIGEQIRRLKKGAQIIVATPGRLTDLINRKAIHIRHVQYCILDEADEMLSMGFQEDIDAILKQTPDDKRTWLFSATMPSAAARIAKKYMQNPVEVTIGGRNVGAENITHTCYIIKEKDRFAALKRLIDYAPAIYGLIFCRTRKETRTVAEKLMKAGYNAEALHGDLSQEQRNQVMRKFRQHTLQMLVATDVAARGLDVDDITHVIHYNLPDESERYTHRSGRTARAGKSGISMLLVNTREARRIQDLERRSGVRFIMGKIPQGRDVCEKQLFAMIEKMVQVEVNRNEIEPYLPPVYKALKTISKQELIQRFVSVEFNRFLEYYRDAEDLNAQKGLPLKPTAKSRHLAPKNAQSFFINIGRMDNIREGAIVRLICDNAGIRSDKIGQISLNREFSFFDVDKRVARKVYKALKGVQLDNRTIKINFADSTRLTTKKRKRKRKKTTKPNRNL